MSFWQALQKALTADIQQQRSVYTVRVRSRQCGGETLQAEIDLRHDLLAQYNEKGQLNGYYCRKLLQGSGADRCFATATVELFFDSKRKLVRREVKNGEFI